MSKAERPKPDRAQALKMARLIGCEGAHEGPDGAWMPCRSHEELLRVSEAAAPGKKSAADRREERRVARRRKKPKRTRPDGFERLNERPVMGVEALPGGGLVGVSSGAFGAKGARREVRRARRDRLAATVAPMRDRIVGSKRNRVGSARSASSGSDIVMTDAVRQALKAKVKEHNTGLKGDKSWQRASEGALQSVYRRGAGAFSVSHRPGMTRGQWAMGRVNAFLKMLKTGKPDNARYTGDNDLLPREHPWKKSIG